jgi:hypothetical protein
MWPGGDAGVSVNCVAPLLRYGKYFAAILAGVPGLSRRSPPLVPGAGGSA